MVIVDTNVVAELMKQSPALAVRRWIDAQVTESVFTTSITQAEVLYGIALLAPGARQRRLADAAAAVFRDDFSGRILAFDESAAPEYAKVSVARRVAGRPIAHADAQIAAIARAHGARIATRDEAGFAGMDLDVVDPFDPAAG
jgi:hypothetical protein